MSIAPGALEMIITAIRSRGTREYAPADRHPGVMGLQFNYDLAFVPVADRAEDERLEIPR